MTTDIGNPEILWLAGLLEGEGSFQVYNKKTPAAGIKAYGRVIVRMTDKDVVERAAEAMGCAGTPTYCRKEEPRQDLYDARRTGKPAVELMRRLYPHMGTRRKWQIESAVEAVERKPWRP